MDYIPDRGHIVWMNFNPQAGREQAGRRPALILSPADYNGLVSLCIVCPITNQQKGYPFEVRLPDIIETTGVILSDHIKSLDWRKRDVEYIEDAPYSLVREVIAKLTPLIG